MSGSVFVFRSRGGNSIRLLYYDGQLFWMAHKRLSATTPTGRRFQMVLFNETKALSRPPAAPATRATRRVEA